MIRPIQRPGLLRNFSGSSSSEPIDDGDVSAFRIFHDDEPLLETARQTTDEHANEKGGIEREFLNRADCEPRQHRPEKRRALGPAGDQEQPGEDGRLPEGACHETVEENQRQPGPGQQIATSCPPDRSGSRAAVLSSNMINCVAMRSRR